jgi:tripartite-type tricarboxylate transporter receptor subunit TctC
MKLPRRKFMHLAGSAAALSVLPRIARAQAYPSRPITMVIPYAAGGPTDVIGRLIAERMRVSLNQTVVVENVVGANGSIGVGRVARAAGDGYNLVMGLWNTHVVNGAIYPLQYDVMRDFAPISLIADGPQLIVAKKATAANDLKELIAWLKANPDKASQGHPGVGSAGHVAGVFFQQQTGTRFQQIPYRGSAPAIQDLVAGQIDLMIDNVSNTLPQVRAGTIKCYAVTSKSRLLQAPEIPTAEEAGLPGYYMSVWFGLFAPRATPKDIITKLNSAAVDALVNSVVSSRLAELGMSISPREQQTPEALGAFQKAEIEKWWPIIKAANIKGE